MMVPGPSRIEIRAGAWRLIGVLTNAVRPEMKPHENEVWLARGRSRLKSPVEKAREVTAAHEHIEGWRRQFSRSQRRVERGRNIAS